MSKKFVSAVAIAAMTILPATVQAQETKKNLNPWQDCGIGSMVFPDNGTASAISNVIWDLGTTAVTSNVSSQDSCGSTKAKTAMFIEATLPMLEQDIAMGEGEYLNAMLELRGCAVTAQQDVVTVLRAKSASNTIDSAQALYSTLESAIDADFTAACNNV